MSFHVGSQQFDPSAWDRALSSIADLRAELRADGIDLSAVNLGGGLPGQYREEVPPLDDYADAIQRAVGRRLGPDLPAEMIIEPGRYLVADAGVLRSEVVTVSTKSLRDDRRWVYLDVGLFSGLPEVMDEAIRYPMVTDGDPLGGVGPVVIAGPTCDSADILYERCGCELPLDLGPGDHVYLLSVGAYSTTCSSVGFNGFGPLHVEVLPWSGADRSAE